MSEKPYFVPIIDNGGGFCRLDFMWAFLKTFGTRTVHSCRISDSHPSRSRNRAAKAFLESDSEYMLFIDADIVFDVHDIDRICQSTEPIIGGVYFLKQKQPVPCAQSLKTGSINLNGEPLEVRRTGTGFLRIHRSVFEKLKEVCPSYTNMTPSPQWDFFGSGVINDEWLSEDWWFCEKARECGFRVMLDTGLILRHEGMIHFPIIPDEPPQLRVCPETMRPHITALFAGEYLVPGIDPPKTVLDLGGNIGGFAVWARDQWPEAKIDSYEPNPDNRTLFKMNTVGLTGVTLHPYAVSDVAGKGTLFTGRDNCGQHSLKFNFEIGGEPVEIVSGADLPKAEFVKIDIEGSEMEFIRSYDFSDTKTVCLEYHTVFEKDATKAAMEEKGFMVVGNDIMNNTQGVYRMVRTP